MKTLAALANKSNQKYNQKTLDDESSGRWTKEEHALFLKGLQQFGRNWKQIETIMKTRTCAQIRSHAQKFFYRIKSKSKYLYEEKVQEKENLDQNYSYFSSVMYFFQCRGKLQDKYSSINLKDLVCLQTRENSEEEKITESRKESFILIHPNQEARYTQFRKISQ